MAFDFPASPSTGAIYTSSDGLTTYLYNGYAWMISSAAGSPPTSADFVLKAGDIMTGYLTLPGPPIAALHAATKDYVDNSASGMPPAGSSGQALVSSSGVAVWGAPIEGGNF